MAKGINTVANMGEQMRTSRDIGHRHVTTSDFGCLRPVTCIDVVPGDVIKLDIKGWVDVAPNAAPINGNIVGSLHAFYVPQRLLFAQADNYHTGLYTGDLPYFKFTDLCGEIDAGGSISGGIIRGFEDPLKKKECKAILSGLGLNPYLSFRSEDSPKLSPWPLMAYERIWFDWYSNKNLISTTDASLFGLDPITTPLIKGEQLDASGWLSDYFEPRYRCFGKDYITSALLSPAGFDSSGSIITTTASSSIDSSLKNGIGTLGVDSYDIDGSISGMPVPQLRAAVAMQKWLEKANFLGKNVLNRLKGMFNSSATPQRLQMSEFLGGNSATIKFQNSASPMSNVGDESDVNAFGAIDRATESMVGQKTSSGSCELTLNTQAFTVPEHGYIIVMSSFMPEPQYFQSIPRMWMRGVGTDQPSFKDFYHPEFEQEGFQPIYLSEVANYVYDVAGDAPYVPFDYLKIFGWTQKYADYLFNHDYISGDFLNRETRLSMAQYHLGRDFLRETGFLDQAGRYTEIYPTAGNRLEDKVSLYTTSTCEPACRSMYDDKFIVPSPDFDHFTIDYKIGIHASRPMSGNALPSLDGEKHNGSPIELGGTRL